MTGTEPRLVLAVHRASSLTGAAKALGIDHSTAFRRLNALEARLGVRLFERLPGGSYDPTAAGERMAAAAERMEDEALALDRDIAGGDHRLSGRLRVTSSETLAYRELTRHLAIFQKAHPGIVVALAVDNRVLSLPRREADIALRPVRPNEGDLLGPQACRYRLDPLRRQGSCRSQQLGTRLPGRSPPPRRDRVGGDGRGYSGSRPLSRTVTTEVVRLCVPTVWSIR